MEKTALNSDRNYLELIHNLFTNKTAQKVFISDTLCSNDPQMCKFLKEMNIERVKISKVHLEEIIKDELYNDMKSD